jgi:hypothetical protein
LSSDILDLYDHEVKQLIELSAELTELARSRQHNYNDFERMIRDRFARLGFLVDVNWYTYAVDDVPQEGALPEITVTGRTDDKFRFDPDRQVHEAVSDVLELGEEGWISTDKDTVRNFLEGTGAHKHGHEH